MNLKAILTACAIARSAYKNSKMNRQQAYEIALSALEERRLTPVDDLKNLVGSVEKSSVSGPDGQTYFLELGVEELPKGNGVRITATVDLGSSFKFERIEESIEILYA
ncbi:MAG: hypothetical protein AAFY56_07360 [Pseudomonadota bacterium]